MNYQDINAITIDRWVEEGWEWGKPISHEEYIAARAGKWDVLLTPTKFVPHEWFGDLKGKRILGLASGGGQQMPVFAALGADCTVLDYSESYASSTSELLVEVLQYMIPHVSLPVVEAETMYAGMLVDTKNFTFKTGTRTFEVASYLKRQGVDTVGVRQYFQPDFDTYAEVSKVTSTVKLIQNRIAIAYCGKETKNMKLVAAMAADQLLNIAGVDASFVLSDKGGDVAISARSLGEINVQVILEKMGGGGHLIAAAASLNNISVEFAEKELIKHIMGYLEK